ncbi:MAG: hypothetical protein CMI13_04680 [Oleibacter sp.]|nr:hypothetical protein [Thalassolituus sp.]|tara:strand:- start:252 stop:479 length:228 start_codon:yes stop_codon:yes gene_type:complete
MVLFLIIDRFSENQPTQSALLLLIAINILLHRYRLQPEPQIKAGTISAELSKPVSLILFLSCCLFLFLLRFLPLF